MSTNAIHIIRGWDWRRILFTIVAGLVTFFLNQSLSPGRALGLDGRVSAR